MQAGGSPFGTPPPPPSSSQHRSELNPSPNPFQMPPPEAAPPINTRPPATSASNFDELGPSDDPLGVGGEDVGGGGISGNRWPRQETVTLLKIRSDMDATFRDATLKGPLWEEVSRKLAELGYKRSAKKCKEKFENVHKYYKRTKEGRAGRQDGKSYRFFSQLEALHNTTASQMPTTPPGANAPPLFSHSQQPPPPVQPAAPRAQPMQISAPTPISTVPPPPQPQAPQQQQQPMMVHHDNPAATTVAAAAAAGISFSTNSSSSLGSESDDDDEATEEGPSGGRKRKRGDGGGSSGGGTGKMMAFFEGLMRQVMERQEAMQQRFLEAIEKREQDRMIREEAWRRQEMSRLAREHELAAQERAAAASRDAAIISFLQKVTGQTIQLPPATPAVPTSSFQTTPQPQPPPPQIHHHQQQQQQQTPPPRQPTPPPPQQVPQQQHHQPPPPQPPPPTPPPAAASAEMVPPMPSSEPQEGTVLSVSLDQASSSRWPKSEVHALIKLRSGLDSRYQESGPKGPLWEEISAGMQRLGYNRSAKRCKEKWENINKYFKKVKESNKKRPEDAKTCPYFHQLDALYRSKLMASGGSSSAPPALTQRPHDHEAHPNPNPNPTPISMIPPATQTHQQQQQQGEVENKNGNGNGGNAEASGGGPSNGGIGSSFFGEGTGAAGGDNSGIMKKPEDIVKELMGGGQPNNNDYGDSDNMEDEDEDDDDEDDEDGNGQFRIQFQRQNVGNSTTSNSSGGASAAPNSAGGKASGSSFLAMVR